ncbi:MAG: serine hydrolase domain-containing protein [Rhizomicrobium sp.]|jgi:CubicO group peptidase (beta-lactamase class C family)
MRLLTIILLAWTAFATPALAAANDTATAQAAITAALKTSKTPGMGVAVIRGGRLAFVAVGGARRIGTQDAVTADDPWLIGSDTKPMTSTMILRLVEQHRLSLDAPLSATDPALAAAARPDYRAITLRQMLSHTSGLPHDYSGIGKLTAVSSDRRPLPEQRIAYLKLALSDAPVSPPGTAFHYSNTAFILAAAIAEDATGLSYEALMQREVFAPLGLSRVRVGLPPQDGNHGHKDGKPAREDDEIPPMMNPAGGVSLSLSDWAVYCIDQLDGAKGHGRLLTAAGYRQMQAPTAVTGNGLDWGNDKTVRNWQGPVLVHTGSDEAWESIVVLFPQSGNGLLVNANAGQSMSGESAAKSVLFALMPLVTVHAKPPAGK